jgi:hypothetical protein
VLDSVADGSRECKQKNLGDGEECSAKDDIADRPTVIEGAKDEDELGDDVDDDANDGPQDVDHPEADRVGVGEAGEAFEGGDGDEEADAEASEAGETEDLYGVGISLGLKLG